MEEELPAIAPEASQGAQPSAPPGGGAPAVGEAPEETRSNLAKRKELPGVKESAAAFASFRTEANAWAAAASSLPKLPERKDGGMVGRTRELEKYVNDEKPDWTPFQKKLAVAALGMYRVRLIDINVRDHCHLLWILAGDSLLRGEDGMAREYNEDLGSFDAYHGFLRESTLSAVKLRLLCLEGLFREFEGDVDRSQEGLLAAMSRAFASLGDGA